MYKTISDHTESIVLIFSALKIIQNFIIELKFTFLQILVIL